MKRRFPFLSFFLAMFVLTSIALSYLLVFNSHPLSKYLSQEEVATKTIQNNQEQLSAYYQPAHVKFEEAVFPTTAYLAKGNRLFDLNHYPTLESLLVKIQHAPIQVRDIRINRNLEDYQALYEQDYIEFDFRQSVPLSLVDSLINLGNNQETPFKLDRILIPDSDKRLAYVVDTRTKSFIEVELSTDFDLADCFNQVNKVKENWLSVDRYDLKDKSVYLPVNEQVIKSKTYILEKIPENMFISSVFPNSDFVISQANTTDTKSYQNYQSTLTIFGSKQLMTITTNSISNREKISEEQKLRESFKPVAENAYWRQGLRYDGIRNNMVTYRRFLDGFPIYSHSSIEDYGALKVYMRNTPGSEVYRFEKPTVILMANIDDMSQDIPLLSADELVTTLTGAGVNLDRISDIQLVYEWQPDMQNFQVVTLIPKWYVEVNGRQYSLDQITHGDLAKQDQAQESNTEGE
ncbi:YycH family regulatory protein [Vaginisenegalia massiliensis]|uniref:YycH family regulatory protein n=1 Tax=Vaginisenegalia massiliensis TaxID=2058294 RepID=UPI000F548F88|nr:two-component system activity regulator YycH [Vaginisenegalia massiliensis]